MLEPQCLALFCILFRTACAECGLHQAVLRESREEPLKDLQLHRRFQRLVSPRWAGLRRRRDTVQQRKGHAGTDGEGGDLRREPVVTLSKSSAKSTRGVSSSLAQKVSMFLIHTSAGGHFSPFSHHHSLGMHPFVFQRRVVLRARSLPLNHLPQLGSLMITVGPPLCELDEFSRGEYAGVRLGEARKCKHNTSNDMFSRCKSVQ